jgi:hypothetical protein
MVLNQFAKYFKITYLYVFTMYLNYINKYKDEIKNLLDKPLYMFYLLTSK